MASRIEDYAIIGDTHTAALVGKDGSIDWLCVPRFDSGAAFAALLGTEDNGRWRITPAGGLRSVERSYRGDSLVLDTTFHTEDGVARITDCMPIRGDSAQVVRIVEGIEGRVPMHMDLRMRFDYGSILPWVVTHEQPDARDRGSRLHGPGDPGPDRGDREVDGGRLRGHQRATRSHSSSRGTPHTSIHRRLGMRTVSRLRP